MQRHKRVTPFATQHTCHAGRVATKIECLCDKFRRHLGTMNSSISPSYLVQHFYLCFFNVMPTQHDCIGLY